MVRTWRLMDESWSIHHVDDAENENVAGRRIDDLRRLWTLEDSSEEKETKKVALLTRRP